MTTEKVKELTQQIASSVNALAAETDEVRKSELFQNWLDAMAQFSSYSFHNQMLIAIQRPDARHVAGYQAWRNLGRFVKKGSKGIAILAPCLYRRKLYADDPDSITVQRLAGFRTCWVFSLEDTEGEPLPELTTSAASGGEDLLPLLEAASSKLNVALDYSGDLAPDVEGYSAGGRIVVRRGLPVAGICGVILHELSHELLHQHENREGVLQKSRRQRELEAEATAYVVMRHFGIDHVASHYLATYNVDGEQLRQSLETISGAAKRLIAVVSDGHDDDSVHASAEPPP